MATIFAIGLVVRVSLILLTQHNTDPAQMDLVEPYRIAKSLANNGTYADVFGHGVGPTAHTAPLLPMILAIIIKVAGVGLAGFLAQAILAAIVSSAAFALLPALAVKCRLGMSPGAIAGLIGATVPINFFNQTLGLVDAPYSMLGLVGLCVVLCSYWIEERFPIRGAVSLGVLSGALCLLNPTILEVLAGWYIFGVLRFKNRRKAFSIFMAIVGAIIVICLSPWAYRNYNALGEAIWTRSNFGLELSVSNSDYASAEYEINVRSRDFPHPLSQYKERERARQMGELAYNQARKKEALSWIRNHRARFSQLTMLRFFYFWFPPMHRWWQSIAEALITILAVTGLLSLLRKNHPSSWMFLAVFVFYPAVYLVIQVGPRYRLPIEPILLLLACCFCLRRLQSSCANTALQAAEIRSRRSA
jgi:hypothetical protein